MSISIRTSHRSTFATTAILTSALFGTFWVDAYCASIFADADARNSQAFNSQSPQALLRPEDLPRLAADAPAPLAALFHALARPFDFVELANGETARLEPIRPDSLLDPEFSGNVVTKAITDGEDDRPGKTLVLTRAGILQYIPAERRALKEISDFEKAAGELPALQRLAAIETALDVTLRFSLLAREHPLKGRNRWDAIRTELDSKLLEVRLALFRERIAGKQTAEGLRHGDELVARYPENDRILKEVAQQRVRYAAAVLQQTAAKDSVENCLIVRRQLEWVEDHLLHFSEADGLRKILTERAAELLAEARKSKNDAAAIKILHSAKLIWPWLPGLEDELRKRQGQYLILNVGVRTLPTHFSPARAMADSELQAVELLFEGLIQARPLAGGSLSYVPQMAASLPTMVENDRTFPLRRTLYWSNGTRVCSADFQKSFELLTSAKLPGRSAELADQVEFLRAGDQPFRVNAKLRQGLLDALAPFTFKVLPADFAGAPLSAADNEAFATSPVGSGPYLLAGTLSEHGRTYVRFVVNPHYAGRTDPAGPKIREVRFFVSRDPAADFANTAAPLHLLLDVPTQDLNKLKAAGVRDLRTLPSRRVFFLAVNHRNPVLADESLRRALAHGINRQQLLADCFGGGRPNLHSAGILAWGATLPITAAASRPQGASFHHPLNGPYPAGSWACCTDNRVPASLFDLAAAETFLQKTPKADSLELELKYPEEDPRVGQACIALAEQIGELGARVGRTIKVRPIPLPIRTLQRDLQARNYQLAYWRHDYTSDGYSLWPLFDPREEALTTGSNYLGFKDDGALPPLMLKASSHRDFNEVKRLTHDIHDALNERMPLIPLWQLDYHVAVHPNLRLPRIDPLRVFANIDEWQLTAK